jgi:glutamyl-tRNA synthetase
VEKPLRLRLAPAPTGFLHLGSVHTFLFNYLYARGHSGTLILRIEDTDVERSTPAVEQDMFEALHWLGITWDEGPDIGGSYGPYRQSERTTYYRDAAELLIKQGQAYECFCTPEELEQERREQQARGQAPRYSGRCYQLSPAEREQMRAAGRPAAVRFHVPSARQIAWDDWVYKRIEFESNTIGDFIILKSDGFPTYNFANVVDDHAMDITLVVRGASHIPNTPRQLLLYDAFGWEPPSFAHLPDILKAARAGKLSKREGAKSVTQYREEGYLPQALVNYLALLGWSSPSGQEFFTMEQLIKEFSFERVQEAGAAFDPERLEWFNAQYIRRTPATELIDYVLPFLVRAGLLPANKRSIEERSRLIRILPLVQERVRTLAEIPPMVDFFYRDQLVYDPALLRIKNRSDTEIYLALTQAHNVLSLVEPWTAESLETALTQLANQLGWKRGDLFMVLRVAETGRTVTPPLLESMEILGRSVVLKRIELACRLLGEPQPV